MYRIVLAVAVEVDDDTAGGQSLVHPVAEGGEAAVASMPRYAIGPRRERDRRGAVARTVVDDDHLDVAHMGDGTRDRGDHLAYGRSLVERRNDDRELQTRLQTRQMRAGAAARAGDRRYARWMRSTFRTTSRRSTQASSKPRPPFTMSRFPSRALRTSLPAHRSGCPGQFRPDGRCRCRPGGRPARPGRRSGHCRRGPGGRRCRSCLSACPRGRFPRSRRRHDRRRRAAAKLGCADRGDERSRNCENGDGCCGVEIGGFIKSPLDVVIGERRLCPYRTRDRASITPQTRNSFGGVCRSGSVTARPLCGQKRSDPWCGQSRRRERATRADRRRDPAVARRGSQGFGNAAPGSGSRRSSIHGRTHGRTARPRRGACGRRTGRRDSPPPLRRRRPRDASTRA